MGGTETERKRASYCVLCAREGSVSVCGGGGGGNLGLGSGGGREERTA